MLSKSTEDMLSLNEASASIIKQTDPLKFIQKVEVEVHAPPSAPPPLNPAEELADDILDNIMVGISKGGRSKSLGDIDSISLAPPSPPIRSPIFDSDSLSWKSLPELPTLSGSSGTSSSSLKPTKLPAAASLADVSASVAAAKAAKKLSNKNPRQKAMKDFINRAIGRRIDTMAEPLNKIPINLHTIDELAEMVATDFARQARRADVTSDVLMNTFQTAVKLESLRLQRVAPSFFRRHTKAVLGTVSILTGGGILTGIGMALDDAASGRHLPEQMRDDEKFREGYGNGTNIPRICPCININITINNENTCKCEPPLVDDDDDDDDNDVPTGEIPTNGDNNDNSPNDGSNNSPSPPSTPQNSPLSSTHQPDDGQTSTAEITQKTIVDFDGIETSSDLENLCKRLNAEMERYPDSGKDNPSYEVCKNLKPKSSDQLVDEAFLEADNAIERNFVRRHIEVMKELFYTGGEILVPDKLLYNCEAAIANGIMSDLNVAMSMATSVITLLDHRIIRDCGLYKTTALVPTELVKEAKRWVIHVYMEEMKRKERDIPNDSFFDSVKQFYRSTPEYIRGSWYDCDLAKEMGLIDDLIRALHLGNRNEIILTDLDRFVYKYCFEEADLDTEGGKAFRLKQQMLFKMQGNNMTDFYDSDNVPRHLIYIEPENLSNAIFRK